MRAVGISCTCVVCLCVGYRTKSYHDRFENFSLVSCSPSCVTCPHPNIRSERANAVAKVAGACTYARRHACRDAPHGMKRVGKVMKSRVVIRPVVRDVSYVSLESSCETCRGGGEEEWGRKKCLVSSGCWWSIGGGCIRLLLRIILVQDESSHHALIEKIDDKPSNGETVRMSLQDGHHLSKESRFPETRRLLGLDTATLSAIRNQLDRLVHLTGSAPTRLSSSAPCSPDPRPIPRPER